MELEIKAFDSTLPADAAIITTVTTEISSEIEVIDPENKDEFTGIIELEGPEEPGSEIVTVLLEWDAGPSCTIKIPITYDPL